MTHVSNNSVKQQYSCRKMNKENEQPIESKILEAAKRVFVRKGFEATKMGEIATEAGIGRTALHYYYRTKDMLYDAIFEQLIDKLLPNIASIIDSDMPIFEKIERVVKSYAETLLKNPLFPVFAVSEVNRDPQRIYHAVLHDEEKIKILLKLRTTLLQEMEAGNLRKIPLHYVATTVISLLVFPMLVRRPMTDMFLEGDSSHYDAFLEERVPFVIEIIRNMLMPTK